MARKHIFLESKCIKPTAKVPKVEAGALVEVQSPAFPLTFYFLPKLKSSAKMSHNHNIFPTWAFREKFGNEREDR